jgi:hypothetical protein
MSLGELCQFWRMVSSGILRRVALVRTDVSDELSASFIRVTRIGELGTSSSILVTLTRATRRNTTEDTIIHSHRRENLKSPYSGLLSVDLSDIWKATQRVESVRRQRLALSVGPNWADYNWRQRQNLVSEMLCFEWKTGRRIISRIVIVALIYHRHRTIECINLLRS